jgi:hypothetical protein
MLHVNEYTGTRHIKRDIPANRTPVLPTKKPLAFESTCEDELTYFRRLRLVSGCANVNAGGNEMPISVRQCRKLSCANCPTDQQDRNGRNVASNNGANDCTAFFDALESAISSS